MFFQKFINSNLNVNFKDFLFFDYPSCINKPEKGERLQLTRTNINGMEAENKTSWDWAVPSWGSCRLPCWALVKFTGWIAGEDLLFLKYDFNVFSWFIQCSTWGDLIMLKFKFCSFPAISSNFQVVKLLMVEDLLS